jgi:hypothetical protein
MSAFLPGFKPTKREDFEWITELRQNSELPKQVSANKQPILRMVWKGVLILKGKGKSTICSRDVRKEVEELKTKAISGKMINSKLKYLGLRPVDKGTDGYDYFFCPSESEVKIIARRLALPLPHDLQNENNENKAS